MYCKFCGEELSSSRQESGICYVCLIDQQNSSNPDFIDALVQSELEWEEV